MCAKRIREEGTTEIFFNELFIRIYDLNYKTSDSVWLDHEATKKMKYERLDKKEHEKAFVYAE